MRTFNNIATSGNINSPKDSLKCAVNILGLRKIVLGIVFVLVTILATNAATITTLGSGNWSSTTNNAPWPGGTVPAVGDNVIIANGHTVTITTNISQTGSVTINSGGIITATTSSTNVSIGPLTISSGGTFTISRQLTVTGATTISGTLNFQASSARSHSFTGDVTLNSGAVWNETNNASSFNFGGNFTNNATTFTPMTGVYTFSGASKTISGSTTTSIPNIAITGTVSNSGTLTVGAALTGSGTLTNSATGVLNIGGTLTITSLVATAATNTVNFNSSGSQTIPAFNYYNLTSSSTGARTLASSGTIGIGGTFTKGTNTYTTTGSTVNFNGTVDQSVPVIAYNNLTFSTSGTKSLAGATTIGGLLTISNTAVANLGSFSSTSLTLTLGGTPQTAGSATYGGTGSAASTINTTYFATATGILTVGTACTTGTWLGTTSTDWNTASNWCGGVPTASTNVVIPNVTNKPTIGTAGGLCNNITINSSSTLIITGSNTLTVSGNWTNNGTFTRNTSTVIFNGTTQSVGAGQFYNLTISGSGTKTLGVATTVNGALTVNSGTTLATANLGLTLGGNFVNSGTFTGGSSSITITGTTAQSIGAFTTTGAISVTKTGGTLTLTGSTVAASLTFSPAAAATSALSINSTLSLGSGALKFNSYNYNTAYALSGAGTLSCGSVQVGIDGTPSSNTTRTNIVTSTLTALTVSGNFTVSSYIGSSNSRKINSSFNLESGTVTVNGALTTTNEDAANLTTFSMASGAQTGTLNLGGATTFTIAGSGTSTLSLAGTSTKVNYTRAGTQTIRATPYTNLTLSGSGAKTFPTGTTTVNGILSIENAADANTFTGTLSYGTNATLQYNTTSARTASTEWVTPFAGTGGIIIKNTGAIALGAPKVLNTNIPLTINSGATLTPGSNLLTLGGNFTNSGTLTSGSGGVTISGTMATQSIAGFTTTGAVSMTKTGGTATLTGNVTGGAFILNGSGGTLDLGASLVHTFSGAWTRTNGTLLGKSSTLNIAGTVTNTAGTFTPGTSTVNYNGTGQTIANVNYYNLLLSGSGTKVFPAAITISEELSLGGTAKADLGTFTSSTNSLTFGGVFQASGSWGSTASTATNKDATNTHFGTTATGILNVTASCIAGTWSGATSTDWNTGSNWCNSVVPTSSTNVTIPSGGNQPVIGSAGGVCNNITINSGATLTITGSNTLTVSGDWTNNGGTFTPNTGSVIFNDTTSDQNILGSVSSQSFYNLTVAKSTFKLILGKPVTAGGTLTMTSGHIDASSNAFELGTSTAATGTLNYTSGNILGNFKRWINAPGALLFPVGTATNNNKALVTFTSLTGGSLTALFTASDAVWNNTSVLTENSVIIDHQFPEGYWTLTAANSLAGTNYALALTGTGFSTYTEDNSVRIIQRTNSVSDWALPGTHDIAGYLTPTAQRTGLNTFGEFAHGALRACSLAATKASTNTTCGNNNGTITVSSPSGATNYEYRLDAGIWQTDGNFTGLASGTYSVQMRDADATGCTSTIGNQLVSQPDILTLSSSVVNVSCYTNGSINISAGGGTAPYSYDWSDLPGTNNAEDRTGVIAGNYTVTVTDVNGCNLTSAPIAVAAATGCTGIDVCKSDAAKVFSVAPDPDVTSYTWAVTSLDGLTDYSNKIVDGQGTSSVKVNWTTFNLGAYLVKVKTVNSCGESAETLLTVYVNAPTATASIIGGACLGTNLQLSAGGGQTYSWTGPDSFTSSSASPEIYNAASPTNEGTYSVTVTDQKGCSAIANVSVTLSAPPTESSIIAASTCGNSDGGINITPSGGSSFTYLWNTSATTQDISSISSGNYSVIITNNFGCSVVGNYIVSNTGGPTASVAQTNVLCNGSSTGDITLTVSGGTPGVDPEPLYTYLWSNGSVDQDLTGLAAGTYSVIITDGAGCTGAASAIITQPNALQLDKILTPINCSGALTGAINITVTGGTGSYTYSWTTADGSGLDATGSDQTNLTAGTYLVTVTDASGCAVSDSYIITQPAAALNASASVTNINCYGSAGGMVTLAVTGGTAPYTYIWTREEAGYGGATTKDITGLTAGTYNITVTDAKGCSFGTTGTVTQPAAALSLSNTQTTINCNGGSTGAIDLTVTGGTPAYTYAWSNGATTQDLSSLIAGTYSCTVRDANGCTAASGTITITEPAAALSATITSPVNVLCNGASTGSINLTVSGGTTAYSYLWSNSAITEDLVSLAAGLYSVTVTDSKGCTAVASTTVTQPAAISVAGSVTNVLCNGAATGAIDITATGGTGTLTYDWSDVSGTSNPADRTLLAAGTYNLTVTDANNCTASSSFTVTSSPALSLSSNNNAISCKNGSDGSINLSVSGGVSPYTYAWTGSNSYTATTEDISNLPSGTYAVTVTDANLCTAALTNLTLTQPAAVLSVIVTPTAVACLGGAAGSVSAAVSGGTEPYSYAWSTGAATATVGTLIAGTYNLTVTDQNGCKTANAQAIVTEPSTRIELFATAIESSSCGIGTGSINLTVVNGTAPFTYAWTNTAQTTANPVSLGANTYTATVTDHIGCSATLPVTVGTAASLSVSVTTYPKNCISTDGSAYAIVTGGVAPYTYLWNNGATTPDITSLDAGTFTITVTDANGCTNSNNGVVGSISCLPPVTLIDNFSTNYNTSMTARTVATNDSDPDAASSPGLTMEFFNETLPSAEQGTLDWSTDYDGVFTFTPASTYAGTFSMPYKVFDPTGLSTTGSFTITVGPKAENDAFGTALNTSTTDDVKTNDIYEIGSSFTKLSDPAHGTVTFNSNGTFTYIPSLNYAGDDSFTYQICLPSPNTGICSTATVTISINGAADVSITKTVDHSTPNVGDNVIFTLSATNNGPNLALGVHVDDVLPAGYTYVSNTAPSLGSFVSGTGIWTIGSIANAATATLAITAKVNATGSYNNSATITSTSNDPVTGNNTASVSTTPVSQSDISIIKTANNLSQSVGQPIIFTLTVTNNGPSAAAGVTANELIPSGYTYASDNGAGTYAPGTGAWTIGNMANGATATLAITATVLGSGTYANTATVSSTTADPTSGNNSSTITPVPGAVSDLSITKTVNNATPYAGGIVEFTLTANNAGPSAATGVVITDLLPDGYTYVSNTTPSAGSFVSETGKWTIGNLANGSSANLKISAKVNASGSYANSATIATTDQPDPVSSDNSATVTPVPVAQADVSIIKTVDTTTPVMGNNVIFTLTVTNNGPSNAAGVSATDVLPSGYTYVSNTAPSAGAFVSSTGIWTIGTLANAASATLAITATVNATGDYINTATVSTTTADLTSYNNTSSKTVNPKPILIITNPAAVCTPSTVNLAATAITAGSTSGLTYTYWTNSAATIPYASPTAATAGTWYIKGTTAAGGSTVEPVVVTVSALPLAPSGTAAQSFCSGAAPTVAELSATGTTIKWYAASSGGTALATSTALVDGTHYYASQTSAGGCESSARFDVTVTLNPNPTITTTTPGSRCGTGNVTLGATASAGTLNWYAASTGGTSLGSGTSFDTPAISASTAYFVAATSNSCTSLSRSYILATVNSFPTTSSITGNATPVCSATEITYSVVLTVGSSYAWTVPDGATINSGATGPNNNTITVNFGTINGKVSVVETNAGSCAGTAKELAISMTGCALNADFTGTPVSVCEGSTVTYTDISTGTISGYSWDFGSGATPSTANTVGPHVITYSTSGLKSVSLTITDGSTSDTETSSNYITVNAASPAPTASVVQPTCATATGSISVTSATAGLYFSRNGSDYSNTNGIFAALTPGTYQITSRNSEGCISSERSVTVNAQPSPPSVPTVDNVIQPTCSTPTGTIVFTTQTGMEYSVGSGYQSSTTFSGLIPATYTLTVRRAADNTCVTAAASTVMINAQPETPTAPAASVTLQPTCSVATGTITVSSGTTGLSFSIDGSAYTNTTGVFTSVVAGDYYVTAKNSDGCISAQSGKVTVDAQPTQVSAPATSVTQPTCTVATGTITVTVQNAGETYSFDNGVSFQASSSKSGLAAGTYQVIIKSTGSCNSAAASATVNDQPATPSAPIASVTQPTCTVATGTITVTVQNAGETYSFDNGVSFQASSSKSGLVSATYQVIIKSTGSCNSTAASATVNDQPATPSAPIASVTQPTCTVATGTITVTVQNAGETYSFDNGVNFQTSNSKSGLVSATYQVIIKSTGGCNSSVASATLNSQPATPSAPVTSVTQPTCTVATGTITVTVQNAGETYSFDNGVSFQSSNSKSGLAAGTYQVIIKSTGTCNSAAASATLNPVTDCAPVVVNDVNAMAEDNPVSGNVSINDTQSGGGNNIWSLVGTNGGAAHGTVTMNTDGTYTYTPDPDFNGTDLFNYHLCNLNGDCSQATVTITVTSVNDLPFAVNNAAITHEDTPISSSVANNDTPSGDGGNIWSLTGINGGAAHGTVTMTADGSYTYTPATGFFGSDTFTYHLCDVNNDCSTSTVNVTVNNDTDGMLAVDDIISTNEDTAVAGNVSANDTPGSEGGNTWTLVGANGSAAHGTVVLAANGSYTYTPDANYNGTDVFTYQLCDQDGDCSVSTVTVTITSVNDLPIAVNDGVSASEDVVLSGSVAGNDTPSGDGGNQWTVVGANGGASHGTVVMSSIGNYTFTPNTGYFGTDSFTYKLCDANGDCSSATVTITIDNDNDGIQAVNDFLTTNEDSPVTGNASTNDTPSSEGGNTWTLVGTNGGAAHGIVILAPNGSYTYTPDANYHGTDVFTYQLCDLDGDCSVATVTITVLSVNDLPIAVNDASGAHEDTELRGSVAGNDTQSGDGGNTWTLSGVNGGAGHSIITMNANGSYTCIPNANYFGSDIFTYKLCDANGDCSTATVTITIDPVNDPPVINSSPLTQSMTEDGGTIILDIPGNTTNHDGDVLTTSIVQPPAHGTVTIDSSGRLLYTPNANYNGVETFTYRVCDNGTPSLCVTGMITVTVTPVNDVPVAVNDVATIAEDGILNGTSLLANDSDPEGNTLTIITTPKTGPSFGTLVINPNGTYTYTPAANYNGTDSFTYQVCDNGTPSFCTTATVTITVTSVNDLPIAGNDAVNAHIDKELNGSVSQNDITSGDGGNVWSVVTPPSNGTLLFNTDGSYTYTPNLNYSGDDSFTYKVCDANGDCSQAVVTIKVQDAVLPNQVFTPNNDGQNDTFLIPGIELYPNNVLTVYNRWGNVVYQKSGYKNEWDGFSNMTKVGNAPLPIGTYFYVLKYGNQQHKTGFVYLDR